MSDRLRQALEASTEEVTVSWGTVLIRHVEVVDLISGGDIPVPLLAAVRDSLGGKQTIDEFSHEDFAKMVPVIDRLVLAAVIDPPICDGDTPEEDEEGNILRLPIKMLSILDRITIASAAGSPGLTLIQFRARQNKVGGTPPSGEDVQPTAEPDAGNN